jgi:superfamily I DNA/RNA helicase
VVTLFATKPEVLESYRQRFKWVSVDEYQDINHAQYHFLRLLVGPETNLCAIGDPNQAIYGFRGADRAYFLKFNQDYPQARVLYLNQNYRSPQLILDASGQVIARATENERSQLWSEVTGTNKIEVYHVLTEKAEAEYVVHEIEKMIGGTSYFSIDSQRVDDNSATIYTFSDFAVLYRLGAQSRALIEAFDRSGIPYQTVGQTPLTETKEIKLILAYLSVAHNPEAALYLERILPGLRTGQLSALAAERVESPWTVVTQFTDLGLLTAAQRRRWREIVPFVTELQRNCGALPVTKLIEQIDEFLEHHNLAETSEIRTARIQQFLRYATLFDENLDDFLEATALYRESDVHDPRADRVTLMTLHAAKGLEFPVVFIVGCEDELIPYRRAGRLVDIDEECRLFYVGMTRAQQRLTLIHARRRFLLGEFAERPRSPFIDDIESSLMTLKEMKPRRTVESGSVQLKLF